MQSHFAIIFGLSSFSAKLKWTSRHVMSTFVGYKCKHYFSHVKSPVLESYLTARPWAERGSRFTRGLLFFFLSVTRRRPPLGQTLSHATCDVFPPEAVKT